MDFNRKNIKVSQVCPGAVETEFSRVRFKGDEKRAAAVYDGFQPLNAGDIADMILYIVKAPAHVNISDVVILPAAQASATIFNRKQS
ncbi:putative oxidoreductase [bioreactor metagenome]|uniref:Putative oxidoreductase n=1 Tax=bioreactor metagenome TaxID=1076179 RepID=A0A645JNP8_9ZZZZ